MSKHASSKRYDILGVQVDAVTNNQAIKFITDWAADTSKPSGYVVKPYVEFFDRAFTDATVRQTLNEAELSIPDGVAVQWAAWYLYGGSHSFGRLLKTLTAIVMQPNKLTAILPGRAAGANFTWPLLEACAQTSLKVYLIGRPVGSQIELTAHHLTSNIEGLNIAGWFDGYDIHDQIDTAINDILKRKPDIILVGIGFPRQEKLMAELIDRIPHGVFIGEGGTFDFDQFGGHKPRAPRLLQRIGLEWLWRLGLEPSRIKRQLAIPRFISRVYRQGEELGIRDS